MSPRTTPKQLEAKILDIIDAYAEGLNQDQVRRRVGCSKRTVGRVLSERGLTRGPPHSPQPPKQPKVAKAKVQECLRLYRAGLPYGKCGSQTGIGETTCTRLIDWYEPALKRTAAGQRKVQGPTQTDVLLLSDLDLKAAATRCKACGIKRVIPIDAAQRVGNCLLCLAYAKLMRERKAA